MKLMKNLLVSLALLAGSASFAAATEVTTTDVADVVTAHDEDALETAVPAVASKKVMIRKAMLLGAAVVIALVVVDAYFFASKYRHTAVDATANCVGSVCGKVNRLFRRAPSGEPASSRQPIADSDAAATTPAHVHDDASGPATTPASAHVHDDASGPAAYDETTANNEV